MTTTKPTLSEAIKQLNETNADSLTIENVLAEYGFEKVTTAQLEEWKKEIGL